MEAHTYIFNRSKRILTTFLLFSALLFGQAQENPWGVQKKGENPWGTPSNKPKETNKLAEADSLVKEWSTGFATDTLKSFDAKTFVAKHSVGNVRYFTINDTIIKLKTDSAVYYKILRKKAKHLHKARAAKALGIATGTAVNFLALPVNLLGSTLPTPSVRSKIQKFKEDNPHATNKEVNAVRKAF